MLAAGADIDPDEERRRFDAALVAAMDEGSNEDIQLRRAVGLA